MLSRVAESLYWSARYVERAEDVTRLLDTNFHALLDGEVADRGASWQQLVRALGEEGTFLEHFDDYTAESVTAWMLWSEGNPNAVAECIRRARENARAVREQISAEMWEAINKLFLLVRSGRQPAARGPHHFFGQVRNYAHLFQGATDATMEHGESYEFIRLGLNLERAEKTTRIVGSYVHAVELDEDDPFRPRALGHLLRSCAGFESYVRRHGTDFEPALVAEELVRSVESPRSVRHCLLDCLDAVERIGGDNRAPRRLLGRLCAGLEFDEPVQLSGATAGAGLGSLLSGINGVGEAVTKAYFSARIVAVGAFDAQEVQQQQCG